MPRLPLKRLAKSKSVRRYVAFGILALTVVIFVRFFADHPDYLQRLRTISPWTIVWVLLLNAAMVGVLVLLCAVTLEMCGKRIAWKENFLLTSYSSIANFFGPLQSGPGVRAVYLKTRHNVRLRDYTLASLLALGFFAFFSALFLFIGTRPWWQTTVGLVAVAALSSYVILLFRRRDAHQTKSQFLLNSKLLTVLLLLTFVQVCVTVGWYYVELRAVDTHVSFSQAMSYAGAANFALFVSITPDAVGIREAFLVFSQHIHHVPTGDIVSANVLDRAVYVVFLGLLFLLVISLHAKDKLRLRSLRQEALKSEQSQP